MTIAGIVLAGGRSQRMGGGDKALQLLSGRPLLAHVIERARPQVAALALSANGDARRFAAFGLPVVADALPDFAGPLAGVLAGLDWAAANLPGATHVASFAADSPFLPRDLVKELRQDMRAGVYELACAASSERVHPVFGLWPLALREDLRAALAEGVRKVELWIARHRVVEVEFPAAPVDPFFNINRPEDLAEAEKLATIAG